MNICIVHSHLHPGGVTRVIESQVKALQLAGQKSISVLVGHGAEMRVLMKLGIEVIVCSAFNYLDDGATDEFYQRQYYEIQAQLQRVLKPGKNIIHVHNPNLGKNPLVTIALDELAREANHGKSRVSVFSHCHDFAEDERPANMNRLGRIAKIFSDRALKKVMYENLPNRQYGVLNQRDRLWLKDFGVGKKSIHFLPNPIDFPVDDYQGRTQEECLSVLDLSKKDMTIVYPVRVIERKNIGEFILLAALFADKANWLVTLAPRNPEEIKHYDVWQAFCKEQGIGVRFGAGEILGFDEVMHLADRIVTTSTKEGFGMAFLEPWTFSKSVVGRDLGDITADFKRQGIQLAGLYDELGFTWANLDADLEKNGDFALLNSDEQRTIITGFMKAPDLAEAFIQENKLQSLFADIPIDVLEHNKEVIRSDYSLGAYGKTLVDIYENII